jgi:acyl-CoA thioesterase I
MTATDLPSQSSDPQIAELLNQLQANESRDDATRGLLQKGASAVPPLIGLLQHNGHAVRRRVAFILGEVGDDAALRALYRAAASDLDPFVSEEARLAAGKIWRRRNAAEESAKRQNSTMQKRCQNCKAPNPAGAQLCASCGKAFAASAWLPRAKPQSERDGLGIGPFVVTGKVLGITVLVVVLTMGCIALGHSSSNNPTPAPTAQLNIVCIGDSITDIWPESLQQRLGGRWTVIDQGVGSDSTGQMLNRFDTDVIACHPQFVVICAGTAALGHGDGTIQIQSNIAMMCDLAVANGVRPVLCTIPPREDENGGYIQSINELNAWVKGYAAEKGYDVIDFYALLNDPANPGHYLTQYSSGDGKHPNTQGYQAMGAYVPLTVFATP